MTPSTARTLIEHGYAVNVERSPGRIFKDTEFEAVGCTLVPEGSWPDVPRDHIILGLKELPENDTPIHHTHVQFAHVYKHQAGWQRILSRYAKGGSTLYDLEFLQDKNGRRVAAFGHSAGFCGAALSLLCYARRFSNPDSPLPSVSAYPTTASLNSDLKAALGPLPSHPRIIVVGALGRCGRGAIECCLQAGIADSSITKWDLEETTGKSSFPEILDCDILINTIYLQPNSTSPPFLTKHSLREAGKERKLGVICDVSCDPNSSNSPLPIYDTCTSFTEPTVRVDLGEGVPRLDVIAIDHLPTLTPRESSDEYSNQLLPSLLLLDERNRSEPWLGAERLYREKVAELEQAEDGGQKK